MAGQYDFVSQTGLGESLNERTRKFYGFRVLFGYHPFQIGVRDISKQILYQSPSVFRSSKCNHKRLGVYIDVNV